VKFLSPEYLWLFVPVAVLVAVYVWMQFRRSMYAVRFSNLQLLRSVAPRSPRWRRHVAAVLILLSLSSGVIAMARPANMVRVPRDVATVVICIDVSLSMQAKDVAPSRLKAAQNAASEFVDNMPARFNVGLISFAGSANLVVPPTTNHEQVVAGINQLQLAESTAIGEAVFTSLDAIKLVKGGSGGKAPPAAIVLLSDGKTNSGRSNDEAAAAAKKAGVPVNTIALGTDGGTVNINGDQEPVPVDREDLHRLAQQTGGQAYDSYTQDQLRQIYQNLGQQIGWRLEPREITMVFVGICLLLVFVASAASLFWQQRIP
jgi:Ca-activated chloride channel family protein